MSEITYRTIPVRDLVMEAITRKPGKKLISHEFAERRIKMAGFILGTDETDLTTKIDALHSNITRKESGILSIDANRSIEATVASVAIGDPHYAQNIVPMDIEFVATQPFYMGTQQTVTIAIPANTITQTITLTVSGSVFAEPTIIYSAVAGTGESNVQRIDIEYDPTGETLTWSGGGDPLDLGSYVKFDYNSQIILEGAAEIEPSGVYSRFEPGARDIILTFQGTTTSTSSTTTSTSSTSTSTTQTTTSTSSTTTSSSTTFSGTTSTSRSTSTTTSTTTTIYPGAAGGTLEIIYRPRYL